MCNQYVELSQQAATIWGSFQENPILEALLLASVRLPDQLVQPGVKAELLEWVYPALPQKMFDEVRSNVDAEALNSQLLNILSTFLFIYLSKDEVLSATAASKTRAGKKSLEERLATRTFRLGFPSSRVPNGFGQVVGLRTRNAAQTHIASFIC